MYDPESRTFLSAGSLTLVRLGIAAAADPTSGTVLAVAGGYTADGPVAACGILRIPTAQFDKPRYLDGDSVTVSGLLWSPGETVKLAVTVQTFARPGQLGQIMSLSFRTVASALGRIQQTLFTASTSTPGATFQVNATGVTSGLTASSLAREISRTNVTISGQPATFVVRASPPAGLSAPPVSGKVTLSGVDKPGGASLVAGAGSSAGTIQQIFPDTGTFSIVVQYGGDANYQATSSAAVQVLVTKATTARSHR